MRIMHFLSAIPLEDKSLEGWTPGFSHRSAGAWLAILLYLIASGLCFRAYRRAALRRAPGGPGTGAAGREIALGWLLVSGSALLLGIFRFFDLGNLLTVLGRNIAHEQGWYGQRRVAQVAGILALALLAIGAFAAIVERARAHPSRLRLAYLATGLILCLIALRACSFHYLDLVLGFEWEGIRLSWFLESAGAALLAGSAAGFRPLQKDPASFLGG